MHQPGDVAGGAAGVVEASLAAQRHSGRRLGLRHRQQHREGDQVEEVLALAKRCGGTIEKEPEDTFWGGYSGYFADPDGHLWEVAWAESWEFNPDGSLVV